MPPFPSSSVTASRFVQPPASSSARRVCEQVFAEVARDFAIDRNVLSAPSRGSPHVALARQTAMYLAHTSFSISFGQIGRACGRDRTTVAHACRCIEEKRECPVFDERLRRLEQRCREALTAGQASHGRAALRLVR